jgi:hypothetical protein
VLSSFFTGAQNVHRFLHESDSMKSTRSDVKMTSAPEDVGDDDGDKESISFNASAALALLWEPASPSLNSSLPKDSSQQQSIFEQFCQDTLRRSLQSHVESIMSFKPECLGSLTSTVSFMSTTSIRDEMVDEEQDGHALEVLGTVERLEEFIARAGSNMPTCFPHEWPILEWVFAPCEATLVEIAYAAATDMGREWSFKAYMELEKAVRACLATAQTVGVNLDSIQNIESSMQVCDALLLLPAPLVSSRDAMSTNIASNTAQMHNECYCWS